MRLVWLLALMAILYAVIVALAITFKPPETVYTSSWKEASKLSKACNGSSVTHKNYTTGEYEVTCYRR